MLDPFCGCGTSVASAQKLGRRWIGIDITHLAINLIKHRLQDAYGPDITTSYAVIGEPVSVDGAEELAASDPYQDHAHAVGSISSTMRLANLGPMPLTRATFSNSRRSTNVPIPAAANAR